jgi:dTDP-4-dehydrorhamnose reductase
MSPGAERGWCISRPTPFLTGKGGIIRSRRYPKPAQHLRPDQAGRRTSRGETDPQAIIARVNLFGWSLSGKRSLAEWFFYNLSSRRPIKGFTDVYFCPLLANHLAQVLLKMLDTGRTVRALPCGFSECLSKYDFGLELARRFSFHERLISPASVERGG